MTKTPGRIVTDSMIGTSLPLSDRWSSRVFMVLGLNPGPFTGPGTNTYLVGTGRDRLLVDTGQGVPDYLPLLEKSLRTAGAERISGIALTHSHPDHVGGLGSVLDRFGPMPVWRMRSAACRASDRSISDGDIVATEGATLQAIWTPGHASDHLCFFLTEEAALFTGDMVLGAGTTVIPSDGDLADYLHSLRRLLAFEATVIYPAHGPLVQEPARRIHDYLAHRALRDRQILHCLGQGPKTIPEMVHEIYSDVPESFHYAAAMSVHAHLRKLANDDRVRQEGELWTSTSLDA